MFFSLPGVHAPHRKNTAASPSQIMPVPSSVTIPMQMHIGKPARPIVKVGDKVHVGTLIAEADGFVSSPIHASVSGTVSKLIDIPTSSGAKCPAVVIESDGEMSMDPALTAPEVNTKDELIAAIRAAGIVGLGGAGFPTHVKFSVPEGKSAECLVINGAECEPYITSDTRTMIERTDDIAYAIDKIVSIMQIPRVIIGIEANKPEAINAMKALSLNNPAIEVKVLPSLYPQGGEKVIVYHTTGKVVAAGRLPIDVGCIVCNCTTIAEIGRYLKTGMPLVAKCLTVDGSAVKSPVNLVVPIGTSVGDVFAFAGGFSKDPEKVLYGGPMMGVAIASLDAPVLKNTNALLALTAKDMNEKKQTACIRCGNCTTHCPFSLTPLAMLKAYNRGDMEALDRLRVDICMECGCCSFICPAAQPLAQTNRLAKAALREYKKSKEKENK